MMQNNMAAQEKIYLLSQGCTANFGEGEQMAGMLGERGFAVTDGAAAAAVLNVCTVKGNGSALKAIREAR